MTEKNICISIKKWLVYQLKFIKFKKEFKQFIQMTHNNRNDFAISWKDRYPCLSDKTSDTPFDPHYIYHLAWAARILAKNSPKLHIDISSSIYFSTIVSAFFTTEFFEYRSIDLTLSNFESKSGDITALPIPDSSIFSLSCMHTVEHIGLGRYGDVLNSNGDLDAIKELIRILAPGGNLLFVVPIGKPRIMFNAHRIYSYSQICEYFKELNLKEFMLIPDNVREIGTIYNASEDIADKQNYGCGCFWFQKHSL
jgi:SAM-dependent methyltransferase